MPHDHTHVQEFFGARAAGWDARFPDDGPVYAAAVQDLGVVRATSYWTRAAEPAVPFPRFGPPWGKAARYSAPI